METTQLKKTHAVSGVKMSTYPKYKDSGVEWLGEIPEHWEMKRFKFLAEAKKGKLPNKIVSINDDHLPPYMSMEYLRGGEENQWVKDSDALIIDKDEILLLWDGSNSGEFLKSRKGVISSTVAHIIFKDIDKNFAWYHSKVLEIELRKNTIGMGIPHVNGRVLNNSIVVLPPLPEQTAIANFLDDKTQKIDQAIGIKEQQIALLKERKQILIHKAVTRGLDDSVPLKDSGVEWIGEIPEHWEVKRLKHITTKIVDGAHFTPTYVDEGIPFLRVTDLSNPLQTEINWNNVKYIPLKEHLELLKRANPQKGDILLSKNGTIGLTKVIDWEEEFSFFVSLCLIKPTKSINPYYFEFFFNSPLVDKQISFGSSRTSVTNLHLEKIKELIIVLPPLKEQLQIINNIKKITYPIDELYRLKLIEIEKLKEYKSSLINSVVTGKVKVC